MVLEQGASSRKVVIDAGAAIKLQRLDRFGGELFTTGGVIREIRDENARAMLKTLPTELRVREPLAEDVAFTKQFAKATGDLGFLSQNDMELIALTVGLHREEGGTVKQRPAMLQTIEGVCAFDWAPANVSKPQSAPADGVEEGGKGEVMEASAEADDEEGWTEIPVKAGRPASSATAVDEFAGVAHFAEASSKTSVAEVLAAVAAAEAASEEAAAEGGTDQPAAALDPATEAADKADAEPAAEASTAAADAEEEDEEEESDAEDDEDGSSAGEWVTQDNMHRFGLGVEAAPEVNATCATADYSVQNVLLQMGITPLTFDGYAVRSVKLWGLVCRACFHFTRDTTKVFCPKCGNDTVVRVPIVVDQDGQAKALTSGRPLRKKGTVYSIPKTQGGRGWKPIYAEDEVLLGGRDRQLRHAENLRDKERKMADPFNVDNACRAWYQRSGSGGGKGPSDLPRMRAGLGRANPNANNYKHKSSTKKR